MVFNIRSYDRLIPMIRREEAQKEVNSDDDDAVDDDNDDDYEDAMTIFC